VNGRRRRSEGIVEGGELGAPFVDQRGEGGIARLARGAGRLLVRVEQAQDILRSERGVRVAGRLVGVGGVRALGVGQGGG
jgi:hypothetical protein